MSFVIAAPETVAAAATDLESIGSTLSAAHAAAAAPTSGILAAAEDEVSTAGRRRTDGGAAADRLAAESAAMARGTMSVLPATADRSGPPD